MANPEAEVVAADLRRFGNSEMPFFRNSNGWRFGFSKSQGTCIFSASLEPQGRSSVESDWRYLGEVSGAIRLPAEAMRQVMEQAAGDNPNGMLKAVWNEPSGS